MSHSSTPLAPGPLITSIRRYRFDAFAGSLHRSDDKGVRRTAAIGDDTRDLGDLFEREGVCGELSSPAPRTERSPTMPWPRRSLCDRCLGGCRCPAGYV
jgi:hypothetical protein